MTRRSDRQRQALAAIFSVDDDIFGNQDQQSAARRPAKPIHHNGLSGIWNSGNPIRAVMAGKSQCSGVSLPHRRVVAEQPVGAGCRQPGDDHGTRTCTFNCTDKKIPGSCVARLSAGSWIKWPMA